MERSGRAMERDGRVKEPEGCAMEPGGGVMKREDCAMERSRETMKLSRRTARPSRDPSHKCRESPAVADSSNLACGRVACLRILQRMVSVWKPFTILRDPPVVQRVSGHGKEISRSASHFRSCMHTGSPPGRRGTGIYRSSSPSYFQR